MVDRWKRVAWRIWRGREFLAPLRADRWTDDSQPAAKPSAHPFPNSIWIVSAGHTSSQRRLERNVDSLPRWLSRQWRGHAIDQVIADCHHSGTVHGVGIPSNTLQYFQGCTWTPRLNRFTPAIENSRNFCHSYIEVRDGTGPCIERAR